MLQVKMQDHFKLSIVCLLDCVYQLNAQKAVQIHENAKILKNSNNHALTSYHILKIAFKNGQTILPFQKLSIKNQNMYIDRVSGVWSVESPGILESADQRAKLFTGQCTAVMVSSLQQSRTSTEHQRQASQQAPNTSCLLFVLYIYVFSKSNVHVGKIPRIIGTFLPFKIHKLSRTDLVPVQL